MAKSSPIIRGAAAIGEYLSIDERSVTKLVLAGELPAFVMAGALCISRATLRKYVISLELYCQQLARKALDQDRPLNRLDQLRQRAAEMMAAEADLPAESPEKKADREERVRRTRELKLPTEEEIRAKVAARRKKAAG